MTAARLATFLEACPPELLVALGTLWRQAHGPLAGHRCPTRWGGGASPNTYDELRLRVSEGIAPWDESRYVGDVYERIVARLDEPALARLDGELAAAIAVAADVWAELLLANAVEPASDPESASARLAEPVIAVFGRIDPWVDPALTPKRAVPLGARVA